MKTSDRATADAYDLDLASSGAGWVGTFSILVRTLVADITDDGPYGPVQVTLSHGEVVTGELSPGSGDDVLRIGSRVIEIEYVTRVQAYRDVRRDREGTRRTPDRSQSSPCERRPAAVIPGATQRELTNPHHNRGCSPSSRSGFLTR